MILMKIGIFTDSHYSSQKITCGNRYNSLSLSKIKEACRFFKTNCCDLILSLGDLIDREDTHEKEIYNLKEVAQVIHACKIPTFCVMGNHDAFAFVPEEFYGILQGCRPKSMSVGNKHLLFLDACYFRSGAHYTPAGGDWTDTYFPFTEELDKEIQSRNGDVYIFMHQNIDPAVMENHCLGNAAELRELFERSGKVRRVYQGHYHPGCRSLHNGIDYITYPAMCEHDGAYFIVDL